MMETGLAKKRLLQTTLREGWQMPQQNGRFFHPGTSFLDGCALSGLHSRRSFLARFYWLSDDANVLDSCKFQAIQNACESLKWNGLVCPQIHALPRGIEKLLP